MILFSAFSPSKCLPIVCPVPLGGPAPSASALRRQLIWIPPRVRAERAAIVLSVGLVATRRSHRPAAHTQRTRPHQDSPLPPRPRQPRQPLHSLQKTQRQRFQAPQGPRRLHRSRLVPRHAGPVEERAAMGHATVLCEVQRLCPRMFDGLNPNTPYRWKRSAP